MSRRAIAAALAVLVILGALGYSAAEPFRAKFLANRECCDIPLSRTVRVQCSSARTSSVRRQATRRVVTRPV